MEIRTGGEREWEGNRKGLNQYYYDQVVEGGDREERNGE